MKFGLNSCKFGDGIFKQLWWCQIFFSAKSDNVHQYPSMEVYSLTCSHFFVFVFLQSHVCVHSLGNRKACAARGDRYDGQRAVLGDKLQRKLSSQNVFLVGAGAIGCELLKSLALMGVGCSSSNSSNSSSCSSSSINIDVSSSSGGAGKMPGAGAVQGSTMGVAHGRVGDGGSGGSGGSSGEGGGVPKGGRRRWRELIQGREKKRQQQQRYRGYKERGRKWGVQRDRRREEGGGVHDDDTDDGYAGAGAGEEARKEEERSDKRGILGMGNDSTTADGHEKEPKVEGEEPDDGEGGSSAGADAGPGRGGESVWGGGGGGAGAGDRGGVVVTDMDTIEKSNLNRQFLFRSGDVGKAKSAAAAAAAQRMNPLLRIKALEKKVL